MKAVIDRKYLLLVVCISSMYKSSDGDCPANVKNLVLQKGANVKIGLGLALDRQIAALPSNIFFNMLKNVTYVDGGLHPDWEEVISVDPSSMTILSASTSPGIYEYTSAAIYMIESPGCSIAFHVVVIETGPTGDCGHPPDIPQATVFNCSITFAMVTKNEMFPIVTWVNGDKVMKTDMPLPKRNSRYLLTTTSLYIVPIKMSSGPSNFKARVTFHEPYNSPVANVVPTPPDYSAECNYNNIKCN